MWPSKIEFLWCGLLLAFCQVTQSADPLKCIKCDDCIKDFPTLTECTAEQTFCFTKIGADNKIPRGCMTEAEKADCTDEKKCFACQDKDGCNNQKVCKNCNSENDANCAQTASDDPKYNSICSAADTKCLVQINAAKHIVRRCATATDTEENLTHLCDSANCNTGIYPADRRKCYQCDKCVKVEGMEAKPCVHYKLDDKCYITTTSETDIKRGCIADREEALGECNDKSNCKDCSTDACNGDAEFTCIQCRSDLDSKCRNGVKDAPGEKCRNVVKPQECFQGTWNNVVIRGCLADGTELLQSYCNDTDSKICTKCNTPNCNNKNSGATLALTTGLLAATIVNVLRFL